jgi:hypothetical protein
MASFPCPIGLRLCSEGFSEKIKSYKYVEDKNKNNNQPEKGLKTLDELELIVTGLVTTGDIFLILFPQSKILSLFA